MKKKVRTKVEPLERGQNGAVIDYCYRTSLLTMQGLMVGNQLAATLR